ncbi:hypothetical protein Q0F98_09340 [Paenibacillus amylolyticus]|nr:hypothetical protein Q0F98_09340 [Paenibacillus amylolyticus]
MSGQIYFIECNGRDQRYGFRKAGMSEHWKATYSKPMAYGRLLLEHNSRIRDNRRHTIGDYIDFVCILCQYYAEQPVLPALRSH